MRVMVEHGGEERPPGPPLLERPLNEFLDDIASEAATPAGGSASALVVAIAAGLVAKAARCSLEDWSDAPGVVAQAEALRRRAAALAPVDAEVYEKALAVLRDPGEQKPERRDAAIARALAEAADVPLRIASIASDVATLGELVATCANQTMRAEAVAATILAEAGARAAAHLVAVNLATMPDDDRTLQARRLVDAAAAASRGAFATTP
jgi:formiminotetrahydrofolate cyclodeaminase